MILRSEGGSVDVIEGGVNVPFPTNLRASDGRRIWKCLVDMGLTAASKSVIPPVAVMDVIDLTTEIYPPRVLLGESYILRSGRTDTLPLQATTNYHNVGISGMVLSTGAITSHASYNGWYGYPHYAMISYVKKID